MPPSEDMPAFEAAERVPARLELVSGSVLKQLQKILASKQFSRAESLRRLFSFLVEQTLAGHGKQLNEYSLGQQVFDRGAQFDPMTDTIVRVQTRKLRARLDEYYRTEGQNDGIVLDLPKGGYEIVISARDPAAHKQAVEEPPQTSPLRKRIFWFSVVACSMAICLALVYVIGRSPRPAIKTVPFTTFVGWESDPAFSSDGRQIAFAWNGQGQDNFDIYIKSIESEVPLRLTTHPGEDRNPVWSPDGQRIAFVRRFQGEDAVFIIPVFGGPERKVHTLARGLVLCPMGVPCLSWSPNEDVLAIVDRRSPGDAQGVFMLSLRTLALRQVTYPSAAQSWGDVSPSFSPDGGSLAFVRWGTASSEVFITAVAGRESRQVTFDKSGIFGVDWMPDGRGLVFSSGRFGRRGIWTVPISGDPRLLVATTDISVVSAARGANRLAYAKSPFSADTNIWRADLTEPAEPAVPLIASTRQEMSPEFSPDGSRIVFDSTRSGSHEVWMCDRDGGSPVQLTAFAPLHAGSPRWSPDGRKIAFDAQSKRSDADIYVIDVDARVPRRITNESSEDIVPCWSEDGQVIYFASTRGGDWQIWKIPAQGGEAEPVTKAGGVMTVGARSGYVYYLKSMLASVWRVPERGGQEEAVLNTPEFHYSRYSALSRRGIYFLDPQEVDSVPRTISFLSFASGRSTRITRMRGMPLVWEPGISVSSDGRWMLYTQVDESSGDITVVENVH